MKNMLTNASKKVILMMSLLASMAVLVSCDGDDDDTTVEPDPDPATVNAGFTSEVSLDNSFTYTFTNTTVILGIDNLTGSYVWDFGGNGSSTDKDPVYTFTEAGEFVVTMTATAADGTVGTPATETITVTAPKNKWARIADTDPDDTGELRLSPTDSIRTGRVTFLYRVPAGASDGFINVSGTSTTGDEALVEVRIKDEGDHAFREGASDEAIAAANFPASKADVWVPVEVSWSANGTDAPTYSVSMDGQVVLADGISTTNGGDGDVAGHLAAVKDGAHTFQWKYGGNSATDEFHFDVDDIVVYSSDSGSEVEVFSDDFQGYQTGTDLHPGEDEANPATVYHINTSEASVLEEE
ncbi:MAG: PKD domain-containing protein [Cyclobacteriaceae bacterium]